MNNVTIADKELEYHAFYSLHASYDRFISLQLISAHFGNNKIFYSCNSIIFLLIKFSKVLNICVTYLRVTYSNVMHLDASV